MFETVIQGLQITQRKVLTEVPEELRLYIPLQGKHSISLEETTFDLHENVQTFLAAQGEAGVARLPAAAANIPNVLLMMGDAGSGKSIFCQTLYLQLWQQYKPNNNMPIPLLISLPQLKNPFKGAVEEVFLGMGFTEAQIAELRHSERFIFIVDGYDELHNFQNIHAGNHWENWHAKVLITCRTQALYHVHNYEKFFAPFVGGKPQPQMLKRVYAAPFSDTQITAYLQQYARFSSVDGEKPEEKESGDVAAADHTMPVTREQLDSIPGLSPLITTPFLLHLTVKSLPDILAQYATGIEPPDAEMTRAKLYDIFINGFFIRQEAKLKATGHLPTGSEDIKPRFWQYCKTLAKLLQAQPISSVDYHPKQRTNRLFAKASVTPHVASAAESLDELFGPDNELILSACPLKKSGDRYSFIHDSMIQYFATRAMCDEEMAREISQDKVAIENSAANAELEAKREPLASKPVGDIHQRLFTQDSSTVGFSADRVRQDEGYKSRLFQIIEQSKQDERYAIGAANAMTILNHAGVNFSGMDFRGVRIPGADLSGAILDGTDFTDADLTGVILKHAFLRSTCFANARMSNVDFGEQYCDANLGDYNDRLHILGGFFNTGRISEEDPAIYDMSYSSHKKLLCVSVKGKVSIIDIFNKRLLKQINVDHNNRTVSISPDGYFVATGGSNNTILLHELKTEKICKLIGHTTRIQSIKFSSNGKMLASIATPLDDSFPLHLRVSMRSHTKAYEKKYKSINENEDLVIRLWDIEANDCRKLVGHIDEIYCVSFSPDDTLLATGSFDNTIRIWDTNTGHCLQILSGHSSLVTALAFVSDTVLVSGSADQKLHVWSIVTGNCLYILEKHTFAITSIAVSSDGALMASGSEDDKIYLWRTSDYQCMDYIDGHGKIVYGETTQLGVNALCFVEDKPDLSRGILNEGNQNKFLAIGVKGSESMRLASITDTYFTENYAIGRKTNSIFNMMYFGDEVLTCDHHGMFTRWNSVSGRPNLRSLKNYRPLMFINSGKSFVVTLNKQELHILNVDTLNTESILILNKPHSNLGDKVFSNYFRQNPEFRVKCPFVSENGHYLVLVEGKEIHIWDIKSNVFLGKGIGHSRNITAICFNPEITLIATGSSDGTVRLWDINTQKCKKIFEVKKSRIDSQVYCLNFSADGSLLASGSDEGIAVIWDVQSSKLIHSLKKSDEAPIYYVYFSPDASILVYANFQNIYFEEIASKICLEKQSCYRSLIIDMKFSQDGSCLAVMTQNTVMMWKISRKISTCSHIPYSYLTTQLIWRSHPEFVSDQVNFDGVVDLSILDEDLLALRHCAAKKTLVGGIASGNLSSVVWFIRRHRYPPGDEVIYTDKEGNEITVLIKAIASGNLPLVKLLIHHGCSIETAAYHYTPLIYAVMERQERIAIYLLEAGASIMPHRRLKEGYTVLHWAIDRKLLTLIKILVARGAPLDVVADNGATPLGLVAFIGELPIAHALLEGLSSPDLKRKVIHQLCNEASSHGQIFFIIELRIVYSDVIYQNENELLSSNNRQLERVSLREPEADNGAEMRHALASALLLPRTQDVDSEVQSPASTRHSNAQTSAQAAQAVGHFAPTAQAENSRRLEPESSAASPPSSPPPEESKSRCSLM